MKLDAIAEGRRLSCEEALQLYDLPLAELGQLAQAIKTKRFGPWVTYIRNYYMNYTNICRYACKYCGFRRNKNDADAYTLSLSALRNKLLNAPEKLREVWF